VQQSGRAQQEAGLGRVEGGKLGQWCGLAAGFCRPCHDCNPADAANSSAH
jgi:hypothetical protein